MIRVGLARTDPTYEGTSPPHGPASPYPELGHLFGPDLELSSTNHVYAAVRASLRALGLDEAHQGGPDWNPLADLVQPGGSVVLKPNFIRHWNPASAAGGTIESVVTHGAILRAVADYAFLAVGAGGSVTLAEAPQQDCDFDEIRRIAGLDSLVEFYSACLGRELRIIDLRRERVIFREGIIVERRALPGDPAGYRAVDLGSKSFFEGSGLDPNRFRGADYDPGPTSEHHSGGRNEYLLSETVLSSDLIVNLPKLKTHKKTGVTLALKNLVGINGDKNWLPHHCVGSQAAGGDEFPDSSPLDRLRSRATEIARPWLARGRLLGLFRLARRIESATRGDDFIRSGNWHGNQTTWRMCCDLNRCVYYSDRKGLHLDAGAPVRRVLSILDGIVAGAGEGPLAPTDVPLGVVLAGTDPIALDLAALRLMGFDESRVPKILGPMRDEGPRITAVRDADEVIVIEAAGGEEGESVLIERTLDDITAAQPFLPHVGWQGHIERR